MLGRSSVRVVRICRAIRTTSNHGSSSSSGPNIGRLSLREDVRRPISTAKTDSSLLVEPRSSFVPLPDHFDHETSEAVDMYHLPKPAVTSDWGEKKRHKFLKDFKEMESNLGIQDPQFVHLIRSVEQPMVDDFCANLKIKKYTLIDPNACNYLCSHMGDLSDPSTAVVMDNAGAGVLSSTLVQKGVKSLYIFEPNTSLRNHLRIHHENDPVTLVDAPLVDFVQDYENPTSNLLLRPDNGFSKLKIIHVVNNSRDLVCLTRNYSTNSTPFQLKDVEFYLVMQENYARRLLGQLDLIKSATRSSGIAHYWNQLFHSEELGSIPSRAFFPTFAKKYARKAIDPNSQVLLLRSRLRTDTTSDGRKMTDLERPLFALYFAHCRLTHCKPVITWLENWAPGIGFRLLDMGVTLFTRFEELSHDEFLRVFFIFMDMVTADNPIWALLQHTNKRSADIKQ